MYKFRSCWLHAAIGFDVFDCDTAVNFDVVESFVRCQLLLHFFGCKCWCIFLCIYLWPVQCKPHKVTLFVSVGERRANLLNTCFTCRCFDTLIFVQYRSAKFTAFHVFAYRCIFY